ncbi:MAG: hypothetical protein ABI639_08900 [Thermoanaerobaculia bacterium]
METRSGRIDFPSHVGERVISYGIGFTRKPIWAEVALAGWDAHYTGNDHHVRQLTVDLKVTQVGVRIDDGWEVYVVARLNLKDDSGAAFEGWIDYLLFLEFERTVLRPPVFEQPGRSVLES